MKVVEDVFGTLPDGDKVTSFTLENINHTQITVISYGATWQSFSIERAGEKQELLVQFDELDSYLNNPLHLGNTIGRVGGRLSKTSYNLSGKIFNLTPNERGNVLHSSVNGFDTVNWQGTARNMGHAAEVKLSHVFDDEFPGQLQMDVTYTLYDDDHVTIKFSGQSTETTLFNPMTHVYFNLVGKNADITKHELQIASQKHVEVDSNTVPTGRLLDNKNTRFDFSRMKKIGDEQFDDAWLLDNQHDKNLVIVKESQNGRALTIDSDRNGVVVFMTNPEVTAHDDSWAKSASFTALAIEMQTLPDAVNHEGFGDIILPAGELKEYMVTYSITD
ncbi:galactose mutarotase [Leuconostoc litchii]|uniref:Galactose mutarotase n=1 Tax=Leuconostoc litchii TaxID=1981069 RepID=A0A6P2CLA0_9LACO|nr:aldose epimerase family protein [Leuconostoc litchii]TYC46775.1 galactose mutarotase [Leuconostoc litchii]GMA70661.1 galactose mutarotase [Leuconostoc litchii]